MNKKFSKKQEKKLYKMKGCSKKTRKNYLGGKSSNINLAYPSNNVHTVPNPFLAYTGKGGTGKNNLDLAYPNKGPTPNGFNFLNPQGFQTGGNCGCGLMKGGCSGLCSVGVMAGGKTHRLACKCSMCKMKGGSNVSNNGIPYPNGLVGTAWEPKIDTWPGVNGVPGDSNYLSYNNYNTDISRQMVATGANPPFSIGGRKKNKKMQKGGVLSNFIGQDLINLGRQFQYGVGSAYNALSGYPSPVNPMPWKGQLPNTPSLSTIKSSYI